MLIGLFGGTFDPVHNGHLAVAEAAVKRVGLDKLYFVPTYDPPHKQGGVLVPFHHRAAMIALAIQGNPSFALSDMEYRHSPSYTWWLVQRAKKKWPNDQIFFVMGMDSWNDIKNWDCWKKLLRSCSFIVSHRPGFEAKPIPGQAADVHQFSQVEMAITATDIRTAIRNNDTVSSYVLDPRVWDYIVKTGIYTDQYEVPRADECSNCKAQVNPFVFHYCEIQNAEE